MIERLLLVVRHEVLLMLYAVLLLYCAWAVRWMAICFVCNLD